MIRLRMIRTTHGLQGSSLERVLKTRSTRTIATTIENGKAVMDSGLSEHDHVIQVEDACCQDVGGTKTLCCEGFTEPSGERQTSHLHLLSGDECFNLLLGATIPALLERSDHPYGWMIILRLASWGCWTSRLKLMLRTWSMIRVTRGQPLSSKSWMKHLIRKKLQQHCQYRHSTAVLLLVSNEGLRE